MRNVAIFFATAMCVVTASQAQRSGITPWVRGQDLIEKITPVDPADLTSHSKGDLFTPAQMARFRTINNGYFYQGYISALHDATEGKSWCFNVKYKSPKQDTFDDVTRQALFSLSATQLKRDASELLIEIWREKWPCPDGGGK